MPESFRTNHDLGPSSTGADLTAVCSDLKGLWITTESAHGPDDANLDNPRLLGPTDASVIELGVATNPPGSLEVVALGLTLGALGVAALLLAEHAPVVPGTLTGVTDRLARAARPEFWSALATSSLAVPILAGPAFQGTGQYVSYALPIPADPAFAGLTVYAQGLLLDPLPSPWMGLTDAAMIVLGP